MPKQKFHPRPMPIQALLITRTKDLSSDRLILLAVIGCALGLLALQVAQGFPSLANVNGDNDSLLRLAMIRDLLAGQSWYDLHQYRLGLAGGAEMHWSRLLDGPIALLLLAFGESVTLALWPLLCFGVALNFLVRGAFVLGDREAILPAAILGSLALESTGVFSAGALDHHNAQLALVLGAACCLMQVQRSPRFGLAAGVFIGLSIAIGMETAPYVAAAGLAIGLIYLVRGPSVAKAAMLFGVGFAATAGLALAATVPPSAWFRQTCDALSMVQFGTALTAGGMLAVICSLPALQSSLPRRAIGLGCVAAAVAAVVVFGFPQCMAEPYAAMDPRLRAYMLDAIVEAQSGLELLHNNVMMAAGLFITPLLALLVLGARLGREGPTSQLLAITLMLLAATGVALWQIRGGAFAFNLAVMPLAAWIAVWRRRQAAGLPMSMLKLVAASLASLNLVWAGTADAIASSYARPAAQAPAPEPATCWSPGDFDQLATLPPGRVASLLNLGSSIIRYTGHSALAGPYHRNDPGNLAMLDILAKPPEQARDVARANADYIVVCRGNEETKRMQVMTPNGLYARLVEGNVPDWLTLLPESKGRAIEIYRVN